jgi:hypothetical protein
MHAHERPNEETGRERERMIKRIAEMTKWVDRKGERRKIRRRSREREGELTSLREEFGEREETIERRRVSLR